MIETAILECNVTNRCPVVGVGSEIDPVEIAGIASAPEFVYNVTGFDALAGVTQAIINMTCSVGKLIMYGSRCHAQ